MAHPSEHAAFYIILAVALVSLVLTALAVAAWRRARNTKLLYVATAFLLFAVKSLVTAWALEYHSVAHEHLELIGSAFDLLIVSLLVAPFLVRA
jgi:hypothetical protein